MLQTASAAALTTSMLQKSILSQPHGQTHVTKHKHAADTDERSLPHAVSKNDEDKYAHPLVPKASAPTKPKAVEISLAQQDTIDNHTGARKSDDEGAGEDETK